MNEIEIGLSQKKNMYKILIYTSHLFTEQKIPHKKILYQIYDKKNRIYRSISAYDNDIKPMYILSPRDGPYRFQHEGHTILMEFFILDDKHLYPFQDKDIFDFVFRMKISADNNDIIERFIHQSLLFHNDLEIDTIHDTIHVYQYVEYNEIWEKYNEIPKRNIDTIYLPDNQQHDILLDIQNFLSKETHSNYQRFGIPYHKTYCFYGPPGSGKTSLIHAICSSINKNACVYRFSPNTKDYDFSNAIKWLPKNSVFVLEDIDCIVKNRDETKGGITFSGVLNILDGLSSIDCLITFVTTNYFIELDTALKRPGRIDYILEFRYIHKSQITKMVKIFFPDEIQDIEKIYHALKNYKMTVTHFQKFLFSLYPTGKVLEHIESFVQEHLKYYSTNDNKLYI